MQNLINIINYYKLSYKHRMQWNFTYKMFQRLVEQKYATILVLVSLKYFELYKFRIFLLL